MKNLVMGVATGYDWYKLEPFVTSFNRYAKNTDLVLFVDNISDFTRARLTRGGVELLPVPAELKNMIVVDARWAMYKKFLDERGENYSQVLLTDVRDVIFQGDVFEQYAELKSFLCYATESEKIKNERNPANHTWLTHLFGKDEADKLADKQIICAGTVLGTVNVINYFLEKMEYLIGKSNTFGDDQAALNYLFYENQLEIENLIESSYHDGNILTAGLFGLNNPLRLQGEKILRGDGGVPAAVHQYTWHSEGTDIVDKIYRDKDFQPDESFNDTRSVLEQIICAVSAGKIDAAYKLFTRYLFGINFENYVEKLVEIWRKIFEKNFTAASELLILSIQGALLSTNGNNFNLNQINQVIWLTDICMKNRLAVSYHFKIFMGNILFNVANAFYNAKQFEQGIEYLNFITALDVPLDANFYLLQAKIYRETGKKAEALAAYSKALNF
ncbi:MAG: tetratricopeptide repeat protein [Selenomonadaceae bacterium]|nr:tetratricopeptide repeat protein [Selenomonadaceae bacterium]